MKESKSELLPIGSVVLLKGGSKKVMVIGFAPRATIEGVEREKGKEDIWDYSGCIYPEGLLASDQILVFDHTQIVEVFHLGMADDEEKAFKKKLAEYLKQRDKKEKKNN